jgi:hypothetical protein
MKSPAVGGGRGLAERGAFLPPHARGLLFKEWLAHRNLIVGFWATWLACGPVLMLFHHPAWIFALGLLYAILAGPAFAGMDAAEGSEEFAFSLPPTRGEVYLARLALSGGNLVLLLAVALLNMKLGLAQLVWSLVVQSGFTEPFPAANGNWYAFAIAAPLSLFALSFAIAALQNSRATVGASWILAALIAAAVAAGGLLCEWLLWQRVVSGISCPLLLALSAGGLFLGYRLYLGKEGVSRPAPVGGSRGWGWVLVVVGIVVLLVLVLMAGLWTFVGVERMDRMEREISESRARTAPPRRKLPAHPREGQEEAQPGQPGERGGH